MRGFEKQNRKGFAVSPGLLYATGALQDTTSPGHWERTEILPARLVNHPPSLYKGRQQGFQGAEAGVGWEMAGQSPKACAE